LSTFDLFSGRKESKHTPTINLYVNSILFFKSLFVDDSIKIKDVLVVGLCHLNKSIINLFNVELNHSTVQNY